MGDMEVFQQRVAQLETQLVTEKAKASFPPQRNASR
jgi:hypothetical protein